MSVISEISSLIQKNVTNNELVWIVQKTENYTTIPVSFVATPRFVSKNTINGGLEIKDINYNNWSVDRLVRVYLLLNYELKADEAEFNKAINILFETAEINEAIALYSALPLFANAEKWIARATDAVRSNIGDIFDSLAFNNIYPSKYFSELAWNQLVLKCIFNDKNIHNIFNLRNRMNINLANTFSDFAHERWAAGRSVPANTWLIVENFVNEKIANDINYLQNTSDPKNRIAAYILRNSCKNDKVKALINHPTLNTDEHEIAQKGWLFI